MIPSRQYYEVPRTGGLPRQTESMRSGPHVLDLGQNTNLSGVSAYWYRSGYCEALAVLPHYPDLRSRAERYLPRRRGLCDHHGCGRGP